MKQASWSEIEQKLGVHSTVFVKAPGRINLIGEHTDYNLGLVMPAAIDRYIYFGIGLNGTPDSVRLFSINYDEKFEFNLDSIQSSNVHWANYLMGVIDQFIKRGMNLKGFDAYIYGEIPIGSGLSSSAAIECGMTKAIDALFQLNLSAWDIVDVGNKTEHEFLGVKSGILDQFASTFGKQDFAMLMDCKTKAFNYVPLHLDQYCFLVINSMVKHSHTTSGYLDRVRECGQAMEYFNQRYPYIETLSDVTFEMLQSAKGELPEKPYHRALFIFEENVRVRAFKKAFEAGDYVKVGLLLNACHEGLRKLYEVSCAELDLLQQFAIQEDGVLGSRMMGGGFGGCTLNLIEKSQKNLIAENIQKLYKDKTGIVAEVYDLNVVDGVQVIQ